jgi:hypothetical protein
LKGEELYHLVADYPKNNLVQWVASEDVQSYLEEDLQFFEGLEHGVERKLPDKVKKELKHNFMSLEERYEMPTSSQLTLLHPYLAYLKSKVTENDNNCLLFVYRSLVFRVFCQCFVNTFFCPCHIVVGDNMIGSEYPYKLLEELSHFAIENLKIRHPFYVQQHPPF